ncbi:DUF302 domain-containing protein [Sulfurovum sp. XGS-02]|uniref:DUF302 domain-containing protein n=1 Tax=Sulfurovum sp. XGS-02 TaxID=2925411 RepID=UPI00206D196D|nr:DUF302 domain-containing protein [Sulfurovum sp. XGS-02]UPT77976.1 DUF302 domain-containing protein [Sulfurovum sp. XGS-02]
MKLLVKGMLCASLIVTGVIAQETVKGAAQAPAAVKSTAADIEIFTSENADGKITPASIEQAFKDAGFVISANRDMNGPFVKQFKESGFDIYNLFTLYKPDTVLELVKKYPNVGLFAPMSMSIYTKKGEKTISVSSLTVEAMAKIMKTPSDDKTLHDLRALVKQTLKKAMPNGSFETLPYVQTDPKGELVTNFTMEMDPDEWEDQLEEFKMGFEGELAPNGFVIAGHNNLGDDFEESNYEAFDFYEVYSVCKLPVIYTIAKTRPEAGAYAPCSLYLSKKKDEEEMKLGFPSVYNWMSSMAIEDTEELDVLEKAQAGMIKILTGLTE